MIDLMKYGGEGMLYNWIWKNDYAHKRWREGVVVKDTRLTWGTIDG